MNGLPYDVPVSMCRSECVLVNQGCQAFFSAQNASLNCDQIDPLTGRPQWPDPSQLTPPETCLTIADLNASLPAEYNCPPPLKFAAPDHDPLTGLPCSTTCHYKIRQPVNPPRDETFHDQWVMFYTLNWFSFVAIIITLVVYSIFPDNRDWPRNINIFLGFFIFLLHLGWIGNSFRTADEQWCASEWAIDTNSNWCLFQSWTSYFAALCIVGYWIFNAVIMFWNVALLRYKDNTLERITPFIHFFIISYAFTASMIILFVPNNEAAGYTPGLTYCFFGPSYEYQILYGLYFWPFYLGVLVVVVACTACMVRIASTASVDHSRWKTLKKRFRPQFTIFLFMVLWLLVVISLIVISKDVSKKQQLVQAMVDWYQCVFTTPGPSSECQNPQGFNSNVAFWTLFMFSTVGLFFTFIYLFINPTQQHLFRKAWREKSPFVRRATASRTSKGSTGSHHSPGSHHDSGVVNLTEVSPNQL